MTSSDSPRGALLAKIGAALQVAQLAGFFASWTAMRAAMGGVAVVPPDDAGAMMAAAAQNSVAIDAAMNYFFAGIAIAAIGNILVIIAATVYRYRANWFFWFLCLYGGAMILTYMVPFGLFFVIYALKKKHQFDLDPPPPGTAVKL